MDRMIDKNDIFNDTGAQISTDSGPYRYEDRFFMGQPQAEFLELQLLGTGWNYWKDLPGQEDGIFHEGTFKSYNVMFIKDGGAELKVNGKSVSLLAGEVFFFLPGQKRIFRHIDKGTTEIWISIDGKYMQNIKNEIPKTPVRIKNDAYSINLLTEFRKNAFLNQYPVFSLAHDAYAITASLIHASHRQVRAIKVDDPLAVVIREIDSNPHKQWAPKKLANEINMSYISFRVKFTRITGLPPATYIRRKKISMACSLLNRGYSVKEACFAIGMQDPYHFSRLFKSIVGIPPSEF